MTSLAELSQKFQFKLVNLCLHERISIRMGTFQQPSNNFRHSFLFTLKGILWFVLNDWRKFQFLLE